MAKANMAGWPDREDWQKGSGMSLAESIVLAQAKQSDLRNLESLRTAAADLLAALDVLGCYELIAASSASEPLVTAAAMMGAGRVSMIAPGARVAEKVVLVDAATVTGSLARSRARELRVLGASWVAAVVYERVRPDLDGLKDDAAFDDFHVLRSAS